MTRAAAWHSRCEYQVRKAAIKKVNKGHSWLDLLEEAMVDTLVKERFLTTPLACNSWVAKSRSRSRKRRGKPKGKGYSGKSKGGNSQDGAWHSTTPDGRQICYKFNNPQERCRGPCSRVHCCRKCLGSHPQHLFPTPTKGGRTRQRAEKRGRGASSTCCASSAAKKGSHPRAANFRGWLRRQAMRCS